MTPRDRIKETNVKLYIILDGTTKVKITKEQPANHWMNWKSWPLYRTRSSL